ncbi:MAG TPA: efflux RND transporter permease subunit [Chiayiivirga sp.]|nr:efflux RND transporter permease subunit [Chiayiivirga sp.]
MSIVELSLRRPVSVIMFFVSLLVIGLIAAVRLPLEQLPEVSAPFLAINLPYAGSTPQEVERTVVRPVEEALATLSGIKTMRSSARADGGSVFVEFGDWSRDISVATTEARDRIDAIRDQLPDDFQRYFVWRFSTADEAMLQIRLASERIDLVGAYDLIDRGIKRRLERLPGVAKIEISGAPPNEVEVAIDPDRITAHGISLNELAQRLQAVNFSVSAGTIESQGRKLRVQPVGEIRELAELRNLVLNDRGVRLSDVANVQLKPARMNYRRQLDGRPAVGIDVFKERSANLVQVSRAVHAEIERVSHEPEFGAIQFKVIEDQGEDVTNSLTELAEAGLIGLLLAIGVLYFFLRHWASTLMVALAIPVCFVMTLGFMSFFGITLNVLSMMGLLLAVGMLVDNAVVVVESIYQEREHRPSLPRLAAIIGTRNVAIALSAGTLCHCIVFLPNLFGEVNQISIFMTQIAITITVSLLSSWLVAISLIPMLAARMATPPAATDENSLIGRVRMRYAQLLDWSLRHRGWSVLTILAIVGVSLIPMKLMKVDMFASSEGRDVSMYYQWRAAYPLDEMQAEIDKVEHWLDQRRDELQIEQIYSFFSEQGWGGTRLTLRSEGPGLRPTEEIMDEIRKGLPKSARAGIGFQGQHGGGGGGGQDGLSVSLIGDSSEVLTQLGDQVVPLLAQRSELRDVRVEAGDRNSELAIHVDRERAARYGFSAQDVARYVGIALRGTPLREFRRDGIEVPVQLRFAGAEMTRVEDLSSFSLRSPSGEQIPLMAVVDVDLRPADSEISRVDRQTMLELKAELAPGHTAEQAREAIDEVLKAANFPSGYSYTFEGNFRQNDEAGAQMSFNTLIALVLIYVVMAAVFESLLFPAAILSGIAFSVLGVFWLFALTGSTFTIMASIGILVLMGVVVNNGIVMVEHVNTLRRGGMSRHDALVSGCRDRLRPILMTMGCAILGMVPISLSTTQIAGGLTYYPMARAIAGGLTFSTIVTLLFLPTIYAMLDDLGLATKRVLARLRPNQSPDTVAQS